MGWTTDLLSGLAQHLDDNGIGTYRSDGSAYLTAETAICVRSIPSEPDRLVTLAGYPVSDPVRVSDVTVGLQVRVRGTTDPDVCEGIADAVRDLWHGHEALVLPGGIYVVQIVRKSYTSLGQDASGRWEASHNYHIDAMRQTTNNPD